jgi:hypothetical protein
MLSSPNQPTGPKNRSQSSQFKFKPSITPYIHPTTRATVFGFFLGTTFSGSGFQGFFVDRISRL